MLTLSISKIFSFFGIADFPVILAKRASKAATVKQLQSKRWAAPAWRVLTRHPLKTPLIWVSRSTRCHHGPAHSRQTPTPPLENLWTALWEVRGQVPVVPEGEGAVTPSSRCVHYYNFMFSAYLFVNTFIMQSFWVIAVRLAVNLKVFGVSTRVLKVFRWII